MQIAFNALWTPVFFGLRHIRGSVPIMIGLWLSVFGATITHFQLDLWAGLRDIRASLSDVFDRYFGDNEAIKFALCANLAYYSDDPDNLWWMAFAMAQGSYMQGGGFYIHGGSQHLTDRLVAEIRKGGGTVIANSPATGIEVSPDGAAAGVHYRDEQNGLTVTVSTSNVFANAAPHLVQKMLPKAHAAAFMERFEGREVSISLLSATLGLDRPPAAFGVASYSTMLVPDWMEKFTDFKQGTSVFSADPTGRLPVMCVVDYGQINSGLSEDGLHSMNIVCADRLANWEGLSDAAYRARRQAWLSAFIARLDAEWPGLAGAVQASTIATAREMHDHLNTPEGATYGFAMTPPKKFPRQPPRSIGTSVGGLWISSAYTGFGGFTGAIGGGIAAAQHAIRRNLGGIVPD
jgi:phytoene dehydrogenase-like protein